jgi:hypothetical protein
MIVFSCSHCRPVVRLEDGWYHVSEVDGHVQGICQASVHRHQEGDQNAHAIANVVNYQDQRGYMPSINQLIASARPRATQR